MVDARLSTAIDEFCQDGPTGLLVALDFDGTLAPFVDDPASARPLPEAEVAIERIAASGVALALVSGRNITDLAGRATPPFGTHLVGSHGAERGLATDTGLQAEELALTHAQEARLGLLVNALHGTVANRPGAWIQTKPAAAVLHTRKAAAGDAAAATADAAAVAERFGLHAMHGKDVVEIAVVETSKGQAIDALREELESHHPGTRFRVLFAGDDTTDEDGFGVLRDGDVGIKVGDGPTAAAFRIADPAALSAVLLGMADSLAR